MKIKLRILFYGQTWAKISRDAAVASVFSRDGVNWMDGDSDLAGRVSSLTDGGKELWITPVMEFTRQEAAQAAFFQFVCRKTVREKGSDHDMNKARLDALPFIPAQGRVRIKLLDRVALTKLALRPNEIAHVDEWTEEYVLPTAMAGIFRKAGLTGFQEKPAFNPGTERNYGEYHLLYSDSLFPPAETDLSFKQVPGDGLGLRQLGCLAYDANLLKGFPDFNRSAEAWYSNDMPAWIVSAKMTAVFKESLCKGLAFKPILDKDGPLYAEYLSRWEQVLRLYPALNRSSPLKLEFLPG